MKVLVLSDYYHTLNNRIAEMELFISLKERGVDISIIADGLDENLDYYEKNNIKVIRRVPNSKYDFSYINFVNKKIKSEKIDILHLFSGNTMRNGVMASYFTNVKVVVYFGSTSLYWHDLSAYLKFLNPRINRILCNSKHVYNHVKRQLVNKDKAVMVYKGYDYKWFEKEETFDLTKFGIPKDAIVVTSIARNTKVKGVKFFFESTYHVDTTENVHFLMLGKYMDTPEISKIIEESPFKKNIHLLGYRTDAIEILKASDVYVQTSLDEGLGRAITESITLKKPVVMTDAGGCTELIEDGKGGFIVPLKNSKAIGQSISKLINDSNLRREMGENAFEYMKSKFSTIENIKGVLKVYNDLIK